ncbi:PhoH family protein, partial [Streptomyces eurythermus]
MSTASWWWSGSSASRAPHSEHSPGQSSWHTSPEQMKMFLTRLGFDSKIVITGDVTQVDLPGGQKSGLRQVQEILEGVEDVHFSRLSSHDVVRHKLVGRIVDAYEQYDSKHGTENGGSPKGGRAGTGARGSKGK